MEQEHLYQEFYPLVERSPQGIAIFQDGRFVYANPAANRILGLKGKGLTRYSTPELMSLLAPTHRKKVEHAIDELFSGKKHFVRDELTISLLPGKKVCLDLHCTRVDFGSRPALLLHFLDIQDRKTGRKKSDKLVEEMRIANEFILGAGSQPDLEKIAGYTSRKMEELISGSQVLFLFYDAEKDEISIWSLFSGNDFALVGLNYVDDSKHKIETVFGSGKLRRYEGALSTLLGGLLPGEAFERMERVVAGRSIWTLGFVMKKMILGGLLFFLPQGLEPPHKKALENIAGYVSVLLQRISAEASLHKSEVRFRALFNLAADAMYIYSLENNIFLEVNQEACSGWGYERDELLSMNMAQLLPAYELDIMKEQVRKLESKKRIMFESAYQHKDGSLMPVDVNIQLIEYQGQKCVFAVNRDISERKQNERHLEEEKQRYRDLSIHLQNIREEQNALIAKEIHDELGQSLTALKMHLSMLHHDLSARHKSDDVLGLIGDMQDILDVTVDQVRKLSGELWPSILEVAGIGEAIENLAREYESYSGFTLDFRSEVPALTMDKDRSLAVYRIVQETFTNVMRHAGASQVAVSLRLQGENLSVDIEDDGRGFSFSEEDKKIAFGILGMQERASMFGGNLEIKSKKGHGTVVQLTMPLL
jgi:PAS domain S-box-containing protein